LTTVQSLIERGTQLSDGIPDAVGVRRVCVARCEHGAVGNGGEHPGRQRADHAGDLRPGCGGWRLEPMVDHGIGELLPATPDALKR
jgi:hypothetical protein